MGKRSKQSLCFKDSKKSRQQGPSPAPENVSSSEEEVSGSEVLFDFLGAPSESSTPVPMESFITPSMMSAILKKMKEIKKKERDMINAFASLQFPLPLDPSKIEARKQLLKAHAITGVSNCFKLDPEQFADVDFPMSKLKSVAFIGPSFCKILMEVMRPHALTCGDEEVHLGMKPKQRISDGLASIFVYQCNVCQKEFRVESHTPSERQELEKGLAKMLAKLGLEKLKIFLAFYGVDYCDNLP